MRCFFQKKMTAKTANTVLKAVTSIIVRIHLGELLQQKNQKTLPQQSNIRYEYNSIQISVNSKC